MKYLKFYVLGLIAILGFIVSGTEEVNAFSSHLDFGALSPRFQYLLDESDALIPFEFELYDRFDSPALAESNNYYLSLEQVTYDGAFIKQLTYYYPEFDAYDTDINSFTLNQTATSASLTDTEVLVLYNLDFLAITSVKVNGVYVAEDDYDLVYDIDIGQYKLLIAGNLSVLGDSIVITYSKEIAIQYYADLYYGWEGIQWDDNNIIFYQLKFDETVIWTGAVMKPPQDTYLDYDVYGLEVGEFLVYGDGTVDSDITGFTDQTQFTSYEDDRYVILHYRIPTASAALYKTIRVTDIINNTLIDAFSTEDLLSLQGGATKNFTNSFVVLPIDNVISNGLRIDYPVSFNDRYELLLDEDYVEGSYYFAIDDGGTLLDGASVVWNIVDNDEDPFNLYLSHNNLTLNTKQRAIFYKNSSIIYNGYQTVRARDYDVNVDYSEILNVTDITYSTEYYPDEDLVEGDTSSFNWRVDPLFMPYSLDVTDFTISMTEVYVYGEERGVAADIEVLRTTFGMSDEAGGIIFSIFILFFINGALLFITRATFIFAITNITIVGVLSYLGLITMWFIIGILLLAFLGIKLSMGRTDSYE